MKKEYQELNSGRLLYLWILSIKYANRINKHKLYNNNRSAATVKNNDLQTRFIIYKMNVNMQSDWQKK